MPLVTIDPATSKLEAGPRNIAERYLRIKQDASWHADNIFIHEPRKAVPVCASPEAVVAYYQGKGNPYTGDPLFGALDHYLHPERLAAALEAGPDALRHRHIDCDDVAGFYARCIALIPGYSASVVTLIDHRIIGSHVVCAWEGGGRMGVADTNGLAILPDLLEPTICSLFSTVYAALGYRYLGAVEGYFPW